MATGGKTDIWVYGDWKGLHGPSLIGVLSALQAKGRKAFAFTYDQDWLRNGPPVKLDPDLYAYTGPQYAVRKENFGVFADAMPDTWGRKLMQRRNAHQARISGGQARSLQEVDYLLGVHDLTRMGALRFKTDPDGPFLDNDKHRPAPPWASIRELQHSAEVFESDPDAYEDEWMEFYWRRVLL
jgi:serine/threonine-protein kinase HipA